MCYIDQNHYEKLPAPDDSARHFAPAEISGKPVNGIAEKRILRMTELNARDEKFVQDATAKRIEALRAVAEIERLIFAAKSSVESRITEIERLKSLRQTRPKTVVTETDKFREGSNQNF